MSNKEFFVNLGTDEVKGHRMAHCNLRLNKEENVKFTVRGEG